MKIDSKKMPHMVCFRLQTPPQYVSQQPGLTVGGRSNQASEQSPAHPTVDHPTKPDPLTVRLPARSSKETRIIRHSRIVNADQS